MTFVGMQKGYAAVLYNPMIRVEGVPLTAGSALVFGSYLIFCLMPVIQEIYDRQKWKKRREAVEKQDVGGYRLWEVS